MKGSAFPSSGKAGPFSYFYNHACKKPENRNGLRYALLSLSSVTAANAFIRRQTHGKVTTGENMAKYSDFLTYCVFGFLATLVNMGSYHLLYDAAGISNVISTALAWLAAVTFAFFTNKFIVFRNRGMKASQVARELSMFYSARFSTGVIDIVFMFITVDVLSLSPLVCKFISNLIQGIINYLAGKLIIFRKR